MTLSAVIFDLDGTLVDTELLWAEAMRDYLADRGCIRSKSWILDTVFGRSWLDIYHSIIGLHPALAQVSPRDMAVDLRAYYIRLREQGDGIVIASSARLLEDTRGDLSGHHRVRLAARGHRRGRPPAGG